MDTIVIILKSLKIDQTVIIQFILFVVFFNVIAPLLFRKIQEVLDHRDSKTTKLETHAHHVYKQAEELQEQYKNKIEKTHQESQSVAQKKKAEIVSNEREILKSEEEKINSDYEARKAKVIKEMAEKRNVIMAEAEKLSANLVDKLTK